MSEPKPQIAQADDPKALRRLLTKAGILYAVGDQARKALGTSEAAIDGALSVIVEAIGTLGPEEAPPEPSDPQEPPVPSAEAPRGKRPAASQEPYEGNGQSAGIAQAVALVLHQEGGPLMAKDIAPKLAAAGYFAKNISAATLHSRTTVCLANNKKLFERAGGRGEGHRLTPEGKSLAEAWRKNHPA